MRPSDFSTILSRGRSADGKLYYLFGNLLLQGYKQRTAATIYVSSFPIYLFGASYGRLNSTLQLMAEQSL